LALERAQRLFEFLTESFDLSQRLVQTALGSISVLAQEVDFLFDFRAARECLERALLLDPKYEAAKLLLAELENP